MADSATVLLDSVSTLMQHTNSQWFEFSNIIEKKSCFKYIKDVEVERLHQQCESLEHALYTAAEDYINDSTISWIHICWLNTDSFKH